MAVVHTYFYIVVDTQRGYHTLKYPCNLSDMVELLIVRVSGRAEIGLYNIFLIR